MKRTILLLVLVFSIVSSISAQEVVELELLKTYTKKQLKDINPLIDAKYDVEVYYIEYTTKKINQEADTASGIISVPTSLDSKFPVMIYEHGTANDRNSVPSKDDNQLLSAVIGTYGYVCMFPDYIGLGISKGLHPYLHPESEAWATIDLLKSIYNLSDEESLNINSQIFVTGYSQGGHAAMATSRALQEEGEYQVTASAPMSGPYSISKEMKAFTLSDEEYGFCGYLGSVFLNAKFVYPDLMKDIDVESVFKSDYAKIIRDFEAETIGLSRMNSRMIALLTANGGKIIPKLMFIDSVENKLENNPEYPLNKALKKMDVCDWVPAFPMKMMYCTADNQVTYRNAVYTDSLMNAKGAENVSAVDVFSSGNHSSCFNFALLNTIKFFGEYQNIETTGIQNNEIGELTIYPNPNYGLLNIKLPSKVGSSIKVVIRNVTGEKVLKKSFERIDLNNQVDITSLESGLFFVEVIEDGKSIANRKLFVMNR